MRERGGNLSSDVVRLLEESDELLWKEIDFEASDTETVLNKIHLLRAAAD